MKMSNTSYTMPTLEEIELFQKGKLNPAREAEIKSLAANNPLVAEALEGFAILPVFAAVPGAESFLNMVANAPGAAASSAAAASSGVGATGSAVVADAVVKTTAWFGAKTLIIAGVSATVAITGTLIVVNQNADETKQIANPASVSNPSSAQSESGSETTPETSASASSADQSAVVDQNYTTAHQTIQYTDAAQAAGQITADNSTSGNHSGLESIPTNTPETLPTLPIDNDALSPSQDPTVAGQRADISGKVMAIGIQTILHYKVADYTKVVRKDWPSFEVDPGGVPAQYESEEAKQAAQQEVVSEEIPYLDYLTLCIQAMDKKDYDLALSHFNQVLDQYPDDVNGLFYSAQCHYYKGEYDLAIALYDKTMRNMINKFNEEAEFYKAKSLKALGKIDESQVLFESIVAKGKFYSQQAARELE